MQGKSFSRLLCLLLALGGAVALMGQSPVLHRLVRSHPAMGTHFQIIVYAPDTLAAAQTLSAAFNEIDRLEQMLSDYRADSEINQLTSQAIAGETYAVSGAVYELLSFSLRLARQSKGAFDPTIGPLSKLWRRAFRQRSFPARSRILAAQRKVNYRKVKLLPQQRVRLRSSELALDFGGLAKGYTLDVISRFLNEKGLYRHLIDAGGDILVSAPPPGQAGWSIAIAGQKEAFILSETTIATSGSTYRFLEWNGRRYSHLIDPRSGLGVTHPRQVTVIGPQGIIADGLASVASILDASSAQRLLRKYPAYQLFYFE